MKTHKNKTAGQLHPFHPKQAKTFTAEALAGQCKWTK